MRKSLLLKTKFIYSTFLLLILLIGCVQPHVSPPPPTIPSNTPPRINNFLFPPIVTRINFEKMFAVRETQHGSVEFFDPDGNVDHATLNFTQGNVLVSMKIDVPTSATQGVIEFRNFRGFDRYSRASYRRSPPPIQFPQRFIPGQVTVDVTVTDKNGAVSNKLARVFVLR
jgi:hypothetical protein